MGAKRVKELDPLAPTSAYELMTRQMVVAMQTELGEIKRRVNGVLFAVVTAIVVDLALRLSGFPR
jgi:hypothetical protein